MAGENQRVKTSGWKPATPVTHPKKASAPRADVDDDLKICLKTFSHNKRTCQQPFALLNKSWRPWQHRLWSNRTREGPRTRAWTALYRAVLITYPSIELLPAVFTKFARYEHAETSTTTDPVDLQGSGGSLLRSPTSSSNVENNDETTW